VLEAALKGHGMARPRAEIRSAVADGAEKVRPLLQRLADRAFARTMADESGARPPTVVLAIDQAEEMFVGDGITEGEGLLALARDLVREDQPATIVLFVIRSDAYDRLGTAKAFDGVAQQTYSLLPMPRGAYQTVIEGPAARLAETPRKLAIEPRLIQRLLEDIEKGGSSDALPLVAFTLEQLYLDYGCASSELRLADYEAFGGINGTIEAAVQRALAAADVNPRIPRDLDARLVLLRRGLIPWLAGIDPETGSPRRRVARLAEVPAEAAPLIRLLVEQRLLATDRIIRRDGDREWYEITIEPSHEAVLREWILLRGWLAEDLAALTTLEGVKRAACDWVANTEKADWLNHTGTRLEEAERFAVRPELAGDLWPEAREYLRCCRARDDAERREKEEALAREKARLAEVAAAQIETQRTFERGRVSLLIALSEQEELRGPSTAALRFALQATRISHRFGAKLPEAANAATKLASLVWQTWRFQLGDEVQDAEFSPDGSRILTRESNSVKVWDLATGAAITKINIGRIKVSIYPVAQDKPRKVTRILTRASGEKVVDFEDEEIFMFLSAVFSPDGSCIVTASNDQTARLWDATTGTELAALRGHQHRVRLAVFSADGTRIATASDDNTVRVWNAATTKEIAVLRGDVDKINTVAFNPSGTQIVTGSGDGMRVWDLKKGRQLAALRYGLPGAYAMFSPDGARIITTADPKLFAAASEAPWCSARLWDTLRGKALATIRGCVTTRTPSAAFSPDGTVIVTNSSERITLWDLATGRERTHVNIGAKSATFSPDGASMMALSDASAQVLHCGDWRSELKRMDKMRVVHGLGNSVSSAAFSPDGTRIMVISSGCPALVWDAVPGTPRTISHGNDDDVNSAAFSPDGMLIVTASDDDTARIWDASERLELGVLHGHEDNVQSAAFSPEGALIVTASKDGTARIWNVSTRTEVAVLRGHAARVNSAVFDPGGTSIVTASADNTARLWDPHTGQEIARLEGHDKQVIWAAFSPDGTRAITAAKDGTARIWDIATRTATATIHTTNSDVRSVAFSPDGSGVIIALHNEVQLNEFTLGGKVKKLQSDSSITGSKGYRNAVFSPDARRIVTASDDNTARIWDTATRKSIAVIRHYDTKSLPPVPGLGWPARSVPARVLSATFSPDGTRIVTASQGGVARIWNVQIATMPTKALIAEACVRLRGIGRMTRSEMDRAGYPDTIPEIDVCET
jgi:WD40 repeat protein